MVKPRDIGWGETDKRLYDIYKQLDICIKMAGKILSAYPEHVCNIQYTIDNISEVSVTTTTTL